MEKQKISDVGFDFIENMDALNESSPLVLSVVATIAEKLTGAHGDYLEKYCEVTEQDTERKVYYVPIERKGTDKCLRRK